MELDSEAGPGDECVRVVSSILVNLAVSVEDTKGKLLSVGITVVMVNSETLVVSSVTDSVDSAV